VVIGERFAWAHLPKTGGMATERLFRIFEQLVVFADPPETNDMHKPFAAREEQIGGKVLAMNLRRLPSWALSRAQHVSRWGIWPDYKPLPMDSAEQLAQSSFPDSRILIFTANGRFTIDRWLRMEHLAEDFLAFISEFTDVDEERRALVSSMGPVNAQQYQHEISEWFTPDQVLKMYERNPLWTAIERQVYGDLIFR
jgi:hypothetical protein